MSRKERGGNTGKNTQEFHHTNMAYHFPNITHFHPVKSNNRFSSSGKTQNTTHLIRICRM